MAGDDKNNNLLKRAGASIIFGKDEVYNSFTYSFVSPLNVGGNHVYNVRQSVGEGGVIFIAEVVGDMSSFVKDADFRHTSEGAELLGVEDVLFVKYIGGNHNHTNAVENREGKIIVGQRPEQKHSGRFFYGCIQEMTL